MASKKGKGSTSNGRDSNPKFLGIKRQDGQTVMGGTIIVRQRGTKFYPGRNTNLGRDHTIYATKPGKVAFSSSKNKKWVEVL